MASRGVSLVVAGMTLMASRGVSLVVAGMTLMASKVVSLVVARMTTPPVWLHWRERGAIPLSPDLEADT